MRQTFRFRHRTTSYLYMKQNRKCEFQSCFTVGYQNLHTNTSTRVASSINYKEVEVIRNYTRYNISGILFYECLTNEKFFHIQNQNFSNLFANDEFPHISFIIARIFPNVTSLGGRGASLSRNSLHRSRARNFSKSPDIFPNLTGEGW